MNGPVVGERGMFSRVEQRLLAPAPPTRLAALRVLVGAYAVVFVVARFPSIWSAAELPARQFEGVGVFGWRDAPMAVWLAHGLMIALIPLGALFVAGRWYRVVGPLFALVFLVVTTYRLSWGHVIHTEHLVVAHLLVLGFAPAADAWSMDAVRRERSGRPLDGDPSGVSPYGWPVQVMGLVTVVAYVLAGIAKLRNGGNDWLVGDVLRNQVAYDNLRKELLGSWHSPLGGWAVRYDWLFPPMAVATVVVELGAPMVWLGRRWRTGWALGAWGFHVGIALLMWISFPYQLCFLAYAPFFAVERLGERWRRVWERVTPRDERLSRAT